MRLTTLPVGCRAAFSIGNPFCYSNCTQ
jgi:hypothetical protein